MAHIVPTNRTNNTALAEIAKVAKSLEKLAQGYDTEIPESDKAEMRKLYDAKFRELLRTKEGAKKLAAEGIGVPLQKFLRQRRQGREWVAVHENYPLGIDCRLDWAAHHTDSPADLTLGNELIGLEIGAEGASTNYVLSKGEEYVKFFSISNRLEIHIDETYRSTYDLVAFAEEKIQDAMGKKEDTYLLSSFDSGATAASKTSTVATVAKKDTLFDAFYEIQKDGKFARTIIAGPGLERSWGSDSYTANTLGLDRVQDITDNGYLGQFAGKNLFFTRYLSARDLSYYGTGHDADYEDLFVLADPDMVGYMPIRQDMMVRVFEDPDRNTFKVNSYENLGYFQIDNNSMFKLRYSVTA